MRIVRTVLIVAFISIGFIGFQWYKYVTNTESPYDEVGIELNSRAPAPINQWGCEKLKETFGNTLPPYGCQSATNATQWR